MTQPLPKEAAQPVKKPAIKVLRSFAAAAAAPPAAQLDELSLNGVSASKAAPATPKLSPEEAWSRLLEEHQHDVAAAAEAIKQRLESCDLKAARAAAGMVKAAGASALNRHGLLEKITYGVSSEDALPLDRQAALATFASLAADGGRSVEPYLLQLLPALLERCGDRASSVREAATAAGRALVAALNPHAARVAVGHLLAGVAAGKRWQAQAAALSLFAALARRAQVQVSHCMLELVPRLSGACAWWTPLAHLAGALVLELLLGRHRVHSSSFVVVH